MSERIAFKSAGAVRKSFHRMGREAALTAIDQIGAFSSLNGAVDSYFENLGDTLTEMGVKDGAPEVFEAQEGFSSVLAAHGITHRPVGL